MSAGWTEADIPRLNPGRVYAALGAMMQTDIHALVIRARTPDEAA